MSINVTNCYNIMHFQRSQPSDGKKFFFQLVDLSGKNSMCFSFLRKIESLGKKRNSQNRFWKMLIHKLVQPHLHKWNDDQSPTNMGSLYQPKNIFRMDVLDDICLRGRHYATKKHPRRKCSICGYRKNKATGKRTNSTLKYYGKCQNYFWEYYFQAFHTQSRL